MVITPIKFLGLALAALLLTVGIAWGWGKYQNHAITAQWEQAKREAAAKEKAAQEIIDAKNADVAAKTVELEQKGKDLAVAKAAMKDYADQLVTLRQAVAAADTNVERANAIHSIRTDHDELCAALASVGDPCTGPRP